MSETTGLVAEGRRLLAEYNQPAGHSFAAGVRERDRYRRDIERWFWDNADALLAAAEAVEKVRAAHRNGDCACDPAKPHKTGQCRECRLPWPCLTVAVLPPVDGDGAR